MATKEWLLATLKMCDEYLQRLFGESDIVEYHDTRKSLFAIRNHRIWTFSTVKKIGRMPKAEQEAIWKIIEENEVT